MFYVLLYCPLLGLSDAAVGLSRQCCGTSVLTQILMSWHASLQSLLLE